jgi:acyl dehydratase
VSVRGGEGDALDISAFPLMRKGRRFEDFEEGQVFEHHWGRTLSRDENALFSTALANWNPLHLNCEYARTLGHPDSLINYMFVLCTVVGLSVEDLSEGGGPFLGIDDCIFHRPVYPGDTLSARSTGISARLSEKRPRFGIVTWRTEASNQHGEPVVALARTNLVARRDSR